MTDTDIEVDYQQLWVDLRGWLIRTRDSGQRTKSVAALMAMKDLEHAEVERVVYTMESKRKRRNRGMP
jgi:hypothetical protein